MDKFIPKQGDIIEVSIYSDLTSFNRLEFIAMTNDNKYLCWSKDKTTAVSENMLDL